MFIENNGTITITATLTTRGRQLLAKGQNQFNIVKFALADTEVNYDLWNQSHANGSAYYGQAIQNMPVLQPVPAGDQLMNYKLVTLPQGTLKLYTLSIPGLSSNNAIYIKFNDVSTAYQYQIKPQTSIVDQLYTFNIANASTIASVIGYDASGVSFNVDISKSNKVGFTAKSFKIITKPYNMLNANNIQDANVTITGNTTGATTSCIVDFDVNPAIIAQNN